MTHGIVILYEETSDVSYSLDWLEDLRLDLHKDFPAMLSPAVLSVLEVWKDREDSPVCLNLTRGQGTEYQGASTLALVQSLDLPFLGSDLLSAALCSCKASTLDLLSVSQVPVPSFASATAQEFLEGSVNLDAVAFPAIVKPKHGFGGRGITFGSLAGSPSDLDGLVAMLVDSSPLGLQVGVLVQELVGGEEITVLMTQNDKGTWDMDKAVNMGFDPPLPLGEDIRRNYPADQPLPCTLVSPKHSPSLCAMLAVLGNRLGACLGCKDWFQFDVRMQNGRPLVIDVNTIPDFERRGLFWGTASFDDPGTASRLVRAALVRHAARPRRWPENGLEAGVTAADEGDSAVSAGEVGSV